ncbi:GntR family transcriptional regulator [Liquorilactobacillus sicerae]|uniref:GntR family transcriptional regulator n=1 Tax=Liquorilactobacillus sicerae TaxID=1416943 RepID=UPI0024818A02|nr:GntR family transcriptional regulator [Liquorilactobacillus sicerae]
MARVQPLYQKMLDDLIYQIESGTIPEGNKLPSENQLCDLYHVSRITVRRALAELEKRKYIFKKQGQGSFVKTNDDEDGIGLKYLNIRKIIESMGLDFGFKVIHFDLIVDGSLKKIRGIMNLSQDTYIYNIGIMYYADQKPCFYFESYLLFNRFQKIYLSEILNNDLFAFLRKKFGFNARFTTKIVSGVIDKKSQKLFDLSRGDPLVNVYLRGFERNEGIEKISFYGHAIAVGDLIMYII